MCFAKQTYIEWFARLVWHMWYIFFFFAGLTIFIWMCSLLAPDYWVESSTASLKSSLCHFRYNFLMTQVIQNVQAEANSQFPHPVVLHKCFICRINENRSKSSSRWLHFRLGLPVSICAFSHNCRAARRRRADARSLARAAYLFPPLRSRDWRLQLSSRCSPWQLEMESEHGAEDKPPHTGRKTLPVSALRSFFPPSGPFKNTLDAFICLLNVFMCRLSQICLFWLRVSKITFIKAVTMALYYALGNDQFYWIYIYFYKFYFSVKNISVFGYLNALLSKTTVCFLKKAVFRVKKFCCDLLLKHESVPIYCFKGKFLVDEGRCCELNERSICGPSGLCWICPQRCQSRCDHTAALCTFADVFVGNKLEIAVAARPTTSV